MSIKTVLVVDDSPTELEFVSQLLTDKGYHVLRASSAEESLDTVSREKPDLIIMDVVMPGMNGFEATRTLARDEATKHIPVVLCTNKSLETDRIWGLRQGAQAYVTKPINEIELFETIKALG